MDKELAKENYGISEKLAESAVIFDYGPLKCLYHGTSKENAYNIVGPPVEIRTESEIGYCGKGFYCYHLDKELAKIYASAKREFKGEKLAILNLELKVHTMFFLGYELYKEFIDRAKKFIEDENNDDNKRAGKLIEIFIEDFQIKKRITVQTISKYHMHSKKKKRATFMFAIRDHEILDKDPEICWEEE